MDHEEFRKLPPEKQTPEICMAAVKQYGYALQWAIHLVRSNKLKEALEEFYHGSHT